MQPLRTPSSANPTTQALSNNLVVDRRKKPTNNGPSDISFGIANDAEDRVDCLLEHTRPSEGDCEMLVLNRATGQIRSLVSAMCAITALAFCAQAFALTSVGIGAFSSAASKLTFEDLTGSGPLPVGYGSGSGVTFSADTYHDTYEDYSSALVAAATAAGLGNEAANFGCGGTCGSGFSLSKPYALVGFYIGSNVPITGVPISAYRNGTLLGTQNASVAKNQVAFIGFQDNGGIDQIVFGDNPAGADYVHQLDNVMFEDLATAASPVAVPTLSKLGMTFLAGLLVLSAGVYFRLRRV
jgi:hypothetical protein